MCALGSLDAQRDLYLFSKYLQQAVGLLYKIEWMVFFKLVSGELWCNKFLYVFGCFSLVNFVQKSGISRTS